MEHPVDNNNPDKGSLSALFLAVAFITNMFTEHYTELFQALTVISLSLVILVNVGKAVKMIRDWIIWIKEFLESFKNK